MKSLLIYEKAAPIRRDTHANVCVAAGADLGFARGTNSVPLLAVEFEAACRDFAIVFAGDEKSVLPAALLGLAEGQNAFVNAEGGWSAGYLPAFFRRYPFVFADGPEEQLTLCIDEAFEGVNTEGRGERLFDSEGNRSRYLEDVLRFSATYQRGFERTRLFCDKLLKLGLLEPAQARFSSPEGQAGTLAGFLVINRQRLKAISEADLKEMFALDELELCFLHLASLPNINRIARVASPAAAPVFAEAEPLEAAVAEAEADDAEGNSTRH